MEVYDFSGVTIGRLAADRLVVDILFGGGYVNVNSEVGGDGPLLVGFLLFGAVVFSSSDGESDGGVSGSLMRAMNGLSIGVRVL